LRIEQSGVPFPQQLEAQTMAQTLHAHKNDAQFLQ
jgi:hypothetical protein